MKSLAFVRLAPDVWVLGTDLEGVPPSAAPGVFFIGDFFSKKEWKWFRARHLATMTTTQLLAELPVEPETTFAPDWKAPSRVAFAKQFADLQERFRQKTLEKAVPVCFELAEQKPDLSARKGLLRKLCAAPPSVTPYGFWFEEEGLLGATPELLLRQLSTRNFATAAVAGTRTREEEPSLLERPKDLIEHQLVIRDIEQALKRWGTVERTPTREVESATLIHLRTDLGVTSEHSFMELVQVLHPTAALGAFPREAGLRWLEKWPESQERGAFGAPFGYFNEYGQGTAWVAIRNIQWNKEGLRLGSGCGVVERSDLEIEWKELELKRLSVKKILGL